MEGYKPSRAAIIAEYIQGVELAPIETEGVKPPSDFGNEPSLPSPDSFINLKNISLYDIVPSPYRRELKWLVIKSREETAAHELHHWSTATALGETVLLVSTIPEGNSLGRTILTGRTSWGNIQKIAAAGSLPTPFGQARGDGWDRHISAIADVVRGYEYGAFHSSAVSDAAQLVASIGLTQDEWTRTAQILAYLGEVPGGMVDDIIARAKWEIDMERNKEKATRIYQALDGVIQTEIEEVKLPEVYTTIEDLNHKDIYGVTIVDGEVEEKYKICVHCGGIDFHNQECLIYRRVLDGEHTGDNVICQKCKGANKHKQDCKIYLDNLARWQEDINFRKIVLQPSNTYIDPNQNNKSVIIYEDNRNSDTTHYKDNQQQLPETRVVFTLN